MIEWLWELCWLVVAICGAGVIKWLWELCWWMCSYCWSWCDRVVMGAVLVGMLLFVGLE